MKHLLFLLVLFPHISRAQIITTCAGNGTLATTGGDGGPATDAPLCNPTSVAADKFGNIYIANNCGGTIRKVNSVGIISTVAGGGTAPYSYGCPATSITVGYPSCVTTDDTGNIYFTAGSCAFKVNLSGQLFCIAGLGGSGYAGDGGPATAASFEPLLGIKIDAVGNIYLADGVNYVVRKINTAGIVTTIAGCGVLGYSPDGTAATNAKFIQPRAIEIDKDGNLYIGNGGAVAVVYKINTAGILSRFAGNGGTLSGCPATDALLDGVSDMAFDKSGDLYMVSDEHVVYRITPGGMLDIVSGAFGEAAFAGDGGDQVNARYNYPRGMCIDGAGNIYIADKNNRRIRRLGNFTGVPVTEVRGAIEIYPNPARDHINVASTQVMRQVEITDVLGRTVLTQSVGKHGVELDIKDLNTGVYFLSVNSTPVGKFVK